MGCPWLRERIDGKAGHFNGSRPQVESQGRAGAAVQGLIDDMLETLYATDNGIGLAATQVGRKWGARRPSSSLTCRKNGINRWY